MRAVEVQGYKIQKSRMTSTCAAFVALDEDGSYSELLAHEWRDQRQVQQSTEKPPADRINGTSLGKLALIQQPLGHASEYPFAETTMTIGPSRDQIGTILFRDPNKGRIGFSHMDSNIGLAVCTMPL